LGLAWHLSVSVASTSSNSQWNSSGLEAKVLFLSGGKCMAVGFELSSYPPTRETFPIFPHLFLVMKRFHTSLLFWVHKK